MVGEIADILAEFVGVERRGAFASRKKQEIGPPVKLVGYQPSFEGAVRLNSYKRFQNTVAVFGSDERLRVGSSRSTRWRSSPGLNPEPSALDYILNGLPIRTRRSAGWYQPCGAYFEVCW